MKTMVNGLEFRSKTEAAWYLVLKAYGLDPVYEPETFEISTGGNPEDPDYHSCWYMPDFAIQRNGRRAMVEVKSGIDGEEQDIAKACVLGYEIPTLIIVGWPLKYAAAVINDRHNGHPMGYEVTFRSVGRHPRIIRGKRVRPCIYPDESWLEADKKELAGFLTPRHEPRYGTVEGTIARTSWNATQWNAHHKRKRS